MVSEDKEVFTNDTGEKIKVTPEFTAAVMHVYAANQGAKHISIRKWEQESLTLQVIIDETADEIPITIGVN